MLPVILFRPDETTEDELLIANKYFPISQYRNAVPKNSLVIGRYSVLPFYDELEKDLTVNGSKLVNTTKQHNWIKYGYYFDHEIQPYTPRTWDSLTQTDYLGPFVVKGFVNSRKHQWDTHMFAKDRVQATLVASTLMNDDPLIQQQGVIFREYIPLVKFETGINGQPFADEWRFFFLGKELISYGYYWSIAEKVDYGVDPAMVTFAKGLAEIVANKTNFYVLDIARTEEGRFILVEINDAQMSGLSMINPETFYKNLKTVCSSNGQGR
jgi:hypothetical protein